MDTVNRDMEVRVIGVRVQDTHPLMLGVSERLARSSFDKLEQLCSRSLPKRQHHVVAEMPATIIVALSVVDLEQCAADLP
jgi:hypothetical protein